MVGGGLLTSADRPGARRARQDGFRARSPDAGAVAGRWRWLQLALALALTPIERGPAPGDAGPVDVPGTDAMVVTAPTAGTIHIMSETAHRPVSQNGSGPSSAADRRSNSSGGSGGSGPGGVRGLLDHPWFNRIASIVVLALAAAIFAYGCNVGQSADDADAASAIVERYPAPGGRALRQTEVGALLDIGYDGRLVVNGVEIPEDQMEGAVDPTTLTPDQLRQYGVRPNNRNRVVFRPGPGKVIEEFERGEVTITLRYFLDRREESGSRTTTWTVTVT